MELLNEKTVQLNFTFSSDKHVALEIENIIGFESEMQGCILFKSDANVFLEAGF